MKKLINALLMLLFFLIGLRLASTIGKVAPFLVGGQSQESIVMPVNPEHPNLPTDQPQLDANGQPVNVENAQVPAQPQLDANGQPIHVENAQVPAQPQLDANGQPTPTTTQVAANQPVKADASVQQTPATTQVAANQPVKTDATTTTISQAQPSSAKAEPAPVEPKKAEAPLKNSSKKADKKSKK